MKADFSGFRRFFEDADTHPDDQATGHGKDGAMDSISATAMELGVPEKALGSVPFVGSNYQFGNHKILGGLSSWSVVDIGPETVTGGTLRAADDAA